jgi:hypothetical protein
MKFVFAVRQILLGAAIMAPGMVNGQSAPLPPAEAEPPLRALAPQDPAAALPATPPPTAPAAPSRATLRSSGGVAVPPQDPLANSAAPRAVRSRSGNVEVAPAIAAPIYAPSSMSYYTQTAPFYRYSTPLDKEMQELVKKEQDFAKKTSDLVASLKGATADKKAEIKTQLIASVEAHFAVRQEQRELQLKRIEEEVKKLREAIEKRNTSKKEIIERRIAELTGEDTIGF